MFVSCVCFVLPGTRLDEPYRACVCVSVCNHEVSALSRPRPTGLSSHGGRNPYISVNAPW